MDIRRASAGDAGPIAAIHVVSWQVGYRGLLPQDLLDGLHPEQRVPRWTTTLEDTRPGRCTLVADVGDKVVGFADLRPVHEDRTADQVGEIASFYVLPAFWGRGIGGHLMTAAEDELRATGFGAASLWVLETNARGIGFYERMGWTPDGATRADTVGGMAVRDLRYSKEL